MDKKTFYFFIVFFCVPLFMLELYCLFIAVQLKLIGWQTKNSKGGLPDAIPPIRLKPIRRHK
jgi:hypothetical protein